jgi:hypothetical protein
MQTTIINQRHEIERLLNTLPDDSLTEVLNFLQYLYFKRNQAIDEPYKIVDTFEGVWQDYPISEEDIAGARREIWGKFG